MDGLDRLGSDWPAPVVGALCNVNRKHARQQSAPGQAMGTALAGRLGMGLGLVFVSWHNPGPVSNAGRQAAVISYQVEPWWRYEGSEFLE